MTIWGGGGAGGWSTNIGGGGGGMPQRRNSDGWDDDYLGKVYDAEVVRRLLPYLREYKPQALFAVFCMIVSSVAQFIQPLLIGLIVREALRNDEQMVLFYAGAMIVLALVQYATSALQQIITAWIGTRILRCLLYTSPSPRD